MVLREERVKEKKERLVEVRKTKREESLREVTVKIRLERIDIQKEIVVEVLLDNRTIRLVISSEFVRKQKFKLKKTKRFIYIYNINSFFNKKSVMR